MWDASNGNINGTLIPVYNAPLIIVRIINKMLYIYNENDERVPTTEADAIKSLFSSVGALYSWMISNDSEWLMFYFFSRSAGTLVTSPLLLPVLCGKTSCKIVSQWNMPPLKTFYFRNLIIPRNSIPIGYVDALVNDSLLGKYYTHAQLIDDKRWTKVSRSPSIKITIPISTYSGPPSEHLKMSSPEKEIGVCSHRGELCKLCRITPGTVVFRWKNTLVSEGIDGPVFNMNAMSILKGYSSHAWNILICVDNAREESEVDKCIGDSVIHTTITPLAGFRKYPDATYEEVEHQLCEYAGKPLIYYDHINNNLVKANVLAAVMGVYIATVLYNDREMMMLHHEIYDVELCDGVVVSKSLF